MSLEIKCHAVPHLKGLIIGKNVSGGQERGSTFRWQNNHEKCTHRQQFDERRKSQHK